MRSRLRRSCSENPAGSMASKPARNLRFCSTSERKNSGELSLSLSLYRESPIEVANSGLVRNSYCHSSSNKAFCSWLRLSTPPGVSAESVKLNDDKRKHSATRHKKARETAGSMWGLLE